MNRLIKLSIAGAVVAGSLAYLLISGFSNYSIQSVEVTDILSNPDKFSENDAEIRGKVVAGSIKRENNTVQFSVMDTYNSNKLNVVFSGYIPSAFVDNATVILKGSFNNEEKLFSARSLVAQCPSRYEGMDIEEHNKAVGKADFNS